MFSFVKERVCHTLQKWKEKIFSIGGREILIKAVALQALPTYTMGWFKLPKGLCEELNKMTVSFWWGSSNGRPKIHLMNWRDLCSPKHQEGMGFRSLEGFNQALLAKQGWQIIQQPSSLLAQIFKAQYFPHSSFWEAPSHYNMSQTWRSILWGRELLRKGTRWRIGTGQSFNMGRDPWLPQPSRLSRQTLLYQCTGYLISSLIIENGIGHSLSNHFWVLILIRYYKFPFGGQTDMALCKEWGIHC